MFDDFIHTNFNFNFNHQVGCVTDDEEVLSAATPDYVWPALVYKIRMFSLRFFVKLPFPEINKKMP